MTIFQVVGAVLLVLSILVLLPIAAFCLECLAALVPRRGTAWKFFPPSPNTPPLQWGGVDGGIARPDHRSRPPTAVLIPAHNEEFTLEETLRAVMAGLGADDRVLVVADNCTDQTAALARRAGAEVVERNDPERRGKGYALQGGLRALKNDPPEVVVVIDADCLAEPQAVDILARLAWRTQRPVQARNLTDRNPAVGPIQTTSLLGNRVTNLIRPLGLLRLGAPCRLTGTGMAIPWPLIQDVQLAGGSLVEDMQLGIDLAFQGHLPLFCPEAGVTSGLPATDRAFATQRTRWEQGHLRMVVTQTHRLLVAAMQRRSWPLLAMAVDLGIPPLTLLAALWLVVAIPSGLAWRFGASWLPAALLAGGGTTLAISLGLVWAVFCRRQVPLRVIAAVPIYMARKLPIYARLLFHREHVWVRTEREPFKR